MWKLFWLVCTFYYCHKSLTYRPQEYTVRKLEIMYFRLIKFSIFTLHSLVIGNCLMDEMAAWIHDAYYVYTSKGRTRVDPLKPEMIQMAMGIGGLVAFLASIFLATLYLPSVVSTTLRFRCGELPIVSNYRTKLHHITFNFNLLRSLTK